MTIRAVCPACQTRLKFHDDLAGLRGRCPKCRGTLLIPAGPPTWEPAGAPKVSARFGLRSIGLLVGLAGVMAVGLALVSWLVSRNPSNEPQAPPVRVVRQPVREAPAVVPEVIPPKPDTPSEPAWVDGRQGVVRDQVRVWVFGVKIEQILIQGAMRPGISDDPYLSINLGIENLKKERILTYRGWGWVDPLGRERPHAILEDRFGNDYPLVRFSEMMSVDGRVNVERIHPSHSIRDVLIFQPPIDQADWLMLTLPGENVGQSGEFRLKVPRSMAQPRDIQPR